MKKSLLLVSAVAVAAFAAPAMAQSVGSAGVAYVKSEADIGPFSADGEGAVADVAAATLVGAWTLTGALNVAYTDADGRDFAPSGSVHVSREFAGLRAGGFVAGTNVGDTLWTVGGQAQKSLTNVTVGGLVSYGTVKDLDVWTIGGEAAYFVQPNLRLDANLAYNNAEENGFDADIVTYGVGGEYKFGASPVSVYGGWNRASTEIQNVDLDFDTFSLGVRFTFGGDLQTRSRSGADLGRNVGSRGVADSLRMLNAFTAPTLIP